MKTGDTLIQILYVTNENALPGTPNAIEHVKVKARGIIPRFVYLHGTEARAAGVVYPGGFDSFLRAFNAIQIEPRVACIVCATLAEGGVHTKAGRICQGCVDNP